MGRKKQPFLLPIKAFGIFYFVKKSFFHFGSFLFREKGEATKFLFCSVECSLHVQQKVYYLVVLHDLNLCRKKLMANNEPIIFFYLQDLIIYFRLL